MSTFDIKKSCTFDGITFPVFEVSLTGAIRRHTHIFPYSPGGSTELMARDNYKIKIKTIFCDSFKNYGKELYPTAMVELRRKFEAQAVADLDVPNLGIIKAYAFSWIFTKSGKLQNGEDAEIVFEEDTSSMFSVENILTQQASGFDSRAEDFSTELDAIKQRGVLSPFFEILDKIDEVAGELQSIVDQAQLFDTIIAAKIDGLTDLLERAADDVDLIKNPDNLTLIESFKNLWSATLDLKDTIANKGKLRPYTVPKDSTLAEICIQLYGNTNRAQEILSLNQIDDPFLIPAGTVLIYSD
jgi:hypothetical protein